MKDAYLVKADLPGIRAAVEPWLGAVLATAGVL